MYMHLHSFTHPPHKFTLTHVHTHTHMFIAYMLTCIISTVGADPSGSSSSCEEEQPSASIKSMWDSVVSWMKTAVDYIAYEENPEDATLTTALSPIGKVIQSPLMFSRPSTSAL